MLLQFKPKGNDAFGGLLFEWLRRFIDSNLNLKPTKFQQILFYIQWNDTTKKLNPDIAGATTAAILNSSRLLGCKKCCKEEFKGELIKEPDRLHEGISPQAENMTILLQIYSFFGKDFNAVMAFDVFAKVLSRAKTADGRSYSKEDIRKMFIVALQNLKYMGYISAGRGSTFLFRTQFFGKPVEAQELLSREKR